MKELLFVALLAFAANSGAQEAMPIEWVKSNAIPLEQSPGIGTILEKHEVQVIGFGEASHGQGSFFQHKADSFKWLAENAGFKVFALEAGFSEALRINQYVLHGQGNAKDGLKYLNYGVWQVQELAELIEWMRAYNIGKQPGQQVQFYGFDCQMAKGGVDYLKALQGRIGLELSPTELQLFEELLHLQTERDKQLAKQLYPRMLAAETSISNKIRQLGFGEEETTLTVVRNLRYFCETEMRGEHANGLKRAKHMAENVEHIIGILGQDTKIAVSAHNGHLSFHPKEKETGYWLRSKFGTRYYALGYEFNHGKITGFDIVSDSIVFKELALTPAEEGSLGNLISTAIGGDALLDLRRNDLPGWFSKKQHCSDILGCYGQSGCNQRYSRFSPKKAFDGVVFFEETVAARRL